MTEPEAVPLDAIEEIDEDPPSDPPPTHGYVDVQESETLLGTVDELRAPKPKPPPMGSIALDVDQPMLGRREPWVAFTAPPDPGEPPATKPTPEEIAMVREELLAQQRELLARVAEIEAQLGFISEAVDIAVRVSKIENFLGIRR